MLASNIKIVKSVAETSRWAYWNRCEAPDVLSQLETTHVAYFVFAGFFRFIMIEICSSSD